MIVEICFVNERNGKLQKRFNEAFFGSGSVGINLKYHSKPARGDRRQCFEMHQNDQKMSLW